MLGPVFWMELRTRSRRRRLFAARTLGTAGLSLVLAVVYFNFQWDQSLDRVKAVRTASGGITYVAVPQSAADSGYRASIQRLAELGAEMFRAYAVGQFILLLLIAPVYCAGCIAGDRERRVLEMVFLTRLNNVELVAGKFLVRLLELCMLGVTGLPALFLCLLLGGVSWQGLLAVGALTVATIAFEAAVALIVSIFAARVLSAVVLTYMTLLLVWAGLPIVLVMRHAATGPPTGGVTFWAMVLNPAIGIASAISPEFVGGPTVNPTWAAAYWYCTLVNGAGAILALLLALVIVRRVGLWASRERVPRGKRREGKKAVRRVWDNPVAWREVKTIAVHRRMRWARIFALLILVMVSTPVWVVYLSDLIERGRALPSDLGNFVIVIVCTSVITWLLMCLQGSMSFAFERDRSTLDALLTTPLTGNQIVLGKLAGIVRSSAFALAFPLLFISMAVAHQVMSWRAALLGAVIVVAGAVLAAAWGLYCSISTATSIKAATHAFLVALILLIGAPLLLGTEMILQPRLQREILPATMASPSLNLGYAIYENADHSSPGDRWGAGLPYQRWDQRVRLAYGHVALAVAFCAALAVLSMQRIERRHRVGPRGAKQARVPDDTSPKQPRPLAG